MSLPSLPIGGSEVFNAADGTGCVEASYLGGDEHPIPDGAGITVTAISFSSDILEVGGSGCSGRSTCQSREVAFTADARGCVVPVLITREPTPSGGQDVTMTMKGVVRCSSGQQQVCQEFVDSLVADLDQGGLDTAVSIEILGSETTSEPEPTSESSPSTESTTPTTDSSAETTDTGTSLG